MGENFTTSCKFRGVLEDVWPVDVPDYCAAKGEVYPVLHKKDQKVVDAAVKSGFPIVSGDEYYMGVVRDLLQVSY